MMSNFFAEPDWLLLLFLLVPAFVLLLYFENMRLERIKLMSSAAYQGTAKRRKFYLLPLLGLTLIILASARPFWGKSQIKIPGTTRDFFVILDVSKSMLADDIKPTRLEFGKRKVLDLVNELRKTAVKARVALILFSGESYLYCPLTEDLGVLEHFIKSVSVDLITSQGTAIGQAINTALESIKEVKSKDPSLLLITDGEDESFDLGDIQSSISQSGFKLFIIGVGTPDGSPIKLGSSFLKDLQGNIVISKLSAEALKKLAGASNGRYFEGSYSSSDIRSFLNQSGEARTDQEINITLYNELGPYIASGLLIVVIFLSFIGKESLILALLLFLFPYKAEAESRSLNTAYKAYKDGNYQKSEEIFSHYYKESPEDTEIAQAYGSSLYKNRKYSEAKATFEKGYEKALSPQKKAELKYNSGNSSFMLGNYRAAIEAFEESLKLNPQSENTRHNLELARKKLAEELKKATPTPSPTPTPPPSSEQEKSKDQNSEKEEDKGQSEEQKNGDSSQSESTQNRKEDENGEKNEKDNDKEQAEENRESANTGQKEPMNQAKPQDKKELPQEKMKEAEAKAWLESLPESPLLLRRKTSRTPNRSRQQW